MCAGLRVRRLDTSSFDPRLKGLVFVALTLRAFVGKRLFALRHKGPGCARSPLGPPVC